MKEFELHTKKPDTYFRGKVMKGYSPAKGKTVWFISCQSYAGGSVPVLKLLSVTATLRRDVMKEIYKLQKRHRLVFKWIKPTP